MFSQDDIEVLLKAYIRVCRDSDSNAQMAFDAQQRFSSFMKNEGETWIYIHDYNMVKEQLDYVVKYANEQGVIIPARTIGDRPWWEKQNDRR